MKAKRLRRVNQKIDNVVAVIKFYISKQPPVSDEIAANTNYGLTRKLLYDYYRRIIK